MLENVNGRSFSQGQKVLLRVPLRGKMAATPATAVVTVNCASIGSAECGNIVEAGASGAAICADNSGCGCTGSYLNVTGTANTACTKDALQCKDLGDKACAASSICTYDTGNSKCGCDASKNFVASGDDCVCNADKHYVLNDKNTECVCDAANHFIKDPTDAAACVCD